MGSVAAFDFLQEFRFQMARIGLHLASCDFSFRRTVIAEFANSQTIFGLDWRAEHTTCHRTGFIELTISCLGIEGWTGLIIGKL